MKKVTSIPKKKIRGKIILLRLDLDLETMQDTFRMKEALPTIFFLRKNGARVVILAHRGRPKPTSKILKSTFKISKSLKPLSLEELVLPLSEMIGERVVFFPHFDFEEIKHNIQKEQEKIFLLENVRFLERETINCKRLAKKFASLGDVYVNDAFATSHRKHSSTTELAHQLPSYAGINLIEEIEKLEEMIKRPKKPLTIVIGGAKVRGKMSVLTFFKEKADHFVLGGGVLNTFLAAEGTNVRKSLFEKEMIPSATKILKTKKVVFSEDLKWSKSAIFDIGDRTIREYKKAILLSRTLVWSGPMGCFEKKSFEKGTKEVWKAVIALAEKDKNAKIIIGGGETIASLRLLPGGEKRVRKCSNIFLSTGGGAMLEFLSGKKLPAIKALGKR